MKASLIIVNYYSVDMIYKLFNDIDYDFDEILIFDNSGDFPNIESSRKRVFRSGRNLGFGNAVNYCVRAATNEFILLLNPDIEFKAGRVCEILEGLIDYDCVGTTVETKQRFTTVSFDPDKFFPFKRRVYSNVFEPAYISGCCMAFRKSSFLDVGGFDKAIFMYAEDLDLGLRMRRAGARFGIIQNVVVNHLSGGTSTTLQMRIKRAFRSIIGHYRVCRKHSSPVIAILSAIYLASGYVSD